MLTNVVVRLEPFHSTTDVFTKFDPFTVKVNAAPPNGVLLGDSEVVAGAGLETVNVSAFEGPVRGMGFTTVTGRGAARGEIGGKDGGL